MAYIYSGLVSFAVAMLAFLLQSTLKENHRLKQDSESKKKKQREALEDGVVCLLRVKLIEYHSRYTEEQRISSHGYENWKLMYDAYRELGGNGMIEHMKDEIEALHIRED